MLDKPAFAKAVLDAADQCDHPLEEEGGVLLARKDDYRFVKIKNKHKGSHTAISLYEADKLELGKLLFDRYKEGWEICASFHTHPSFSPYPSNLDLDTLFQGFKHNVIYAARNHGVFSYSTWENDQSVLKEIVTREELSKTQNE
jgi:proteasome lid subunit RPN8/RPN11